MNFTSSDFREKIKSYNNTSGMPQEKWLFNQVVSRFSASFCYVASNKNSAFSEISSVGDTSGKLTDHQLF